MFCGSLGFPSMCSDIFEFPFLICERLAAVLIYLISLMMQLLWPRMVMKKWLNIKSGDDFSADEHEEDKDFDTESENESESEGAYILCTTTIVCYNFVFIIHQFRTLIVFSQITLGKYAHFESHFLWFLEKMEMMVSFFLLLCAMYCLLSYLDYGYILDFTTFA